MFLYIHESPYVGRIRESKIGLWFCFFLCRNCTRLYKKFIVQRTDQMSELAACASPGDRTPHLVPTGRSLKHQQFTVLIKFSHFTIYASNYSSIISRGDSFCASQPKSI